MDQSHERSTQPTSIPKRVGLPVDTRTHGRPAFRSILFPPGLEHERNERFGQPDCFLDLNLDQVVAAVIAKRDEDVLRPFFFSTYRDETVVRYRQDVFRDLEKVDVFPLFPAFRESMWKVRLDLGYAQKITYQRHKDMVRLRAIALYCEAIKTLRNQLHFRDLQSAGLRGLRQYLSDYASSDFFVQLAAETADITTKLSGVQYGMLFRGDKVTVRRYASERDYAVKVIDRFERFREVDIEPAAARVKDDRSLNHIEEGILEFVGRLFPEEFASLEDYAGRHLQFIDDTVQVFDREIGFFLAYRSYIASLKAAGLQFCYPEVSASDKETSVTQGFDLALAAKLLAEKSKVVCNDFQLAGTERMIVVSGPNQGGKTTFARMFGQMHFLAGLGCAVPGRNARLFLADRIFTHFEREENITNLRGKLEDELVRLHDSYRTMTSESVIVLNEIFNSTSLEDQTFLCTKVLERILAADPLGVCVTFLDGLATLSDKTVSMVSTVEPDDPARRTFEIVRKPADGLAYALSLAEKRGVTYERLRTRVRP